MNKIANQKMRFFTLAFLLLGGCSGTPPTEISPTPSTLSAPAATLPPVPSDPACNRPHVSIKLDTFQSCLVEGMSYIQVANILGSAGTLQAQSGSAQVWEWGDGNGGFLFVSFRDQLMISKSQTGLARQ
jgi:hypothetical protein